MSEAATAKPKRRFWQIHLSTAVLLMFVSGVFLFLDTIGKMDVSHEPYERVFAQDSFNVYTTNCIQENRHTSYGFPYPCFVQTESIRRNNMNIAESDVISSNWKLAECAVDILVFFAFIVACVFVCEYLIRRREARKP